MESARRTSGADPPGQATRFSTDEDGRARCAALIQELEPAIFRLLYGLVGHRETAEDLLQETFASVWAAWAQYDATKDKVAWTYTIARNVHVDYVRRTKAIKRGGSTRTVNAGRPDEDGRAIDEFADILAENPANVAIRREAENAMHEAASRLSAEDRELYSLSISGLGIEDIVRRTGRTKSALESALSRMRKRLRGILAPHDL